MSPRSEDSSSSTLRDFLLGSRGVDDQLHREVLHDLGKTLELHSRAGLRTVRHGLGKATAELLDLELIDVLVAAWSRYDRLRAAARASLSSPEPQTVILLEHTVTSKHDPRIDVLVDGARRTTVRFELGLQFWIKGLVATVQAGRLVALEVAACDLKASVRCEGRKLLERSGTLVLPRTVTLPHGGIEVAASVELDEGELAPPPSG